MPLESSSETEDKIKVKTEVFEGPLDLLLNLIEKRKLFISDISLAKVTEDYIDYVNSQRVFPVNQASHFIYISSTLLLIKSKSLLPDMQITEEEEQDIEDLEHRLRLYKIFKNLGKDLEKRFGRKMLFARVVKGHEPIFSPDEDLSVDLLSGAMNRVLNNLPRDNKMEKAVVEKTVSLGEVIEDLKRRITYSIQLSFNSFAKNGRSKPDMIVNFMALLELVKNDFIDARQVYNFEDITLEVKNVSLPRYE